MKKLSKLGKSVLLSSLAVLAFGGVAAGTTYALFTDKQETNVTVTAGKVSVKSDVKIKSVFSPKTIASDGEASEENTATLTDEKNGTFANGGSVKIDDNGQIALKNLTPGDKVTFTLSLTNNSTVAFKLRSRLLKTNDTGLYAGLKVEAPENFGTWEAKVPGDDLASFEVTVSLPSDAGNEYQDKSCGLSLIVDAVQGNADTDTYTIGSAVELSVFAEEIKNGTFHSNKVSLTADIDMENQTYLSPNLTTSLVFEGNGHTISNFAPIALENGSVGLFGRVVAALTVNNLKFDNATIVGKGIDGSVYAGGVVVGWNEGYSQGHAVTLHGIEVKNSMVSENKYSGAFVGYASNTDGFTIENCVVFNTIVKGRTAGGFIGQFGGGKGGVVSPKGTGISVTGTHREGGLIGAVSGTAAEVTGYSTSDYQSEISWSADADKGEIIGLAGDTTVNGKKIEYSDLSELLSSENAGYFTFGNTKDGKIVIDGGELGITIRNFQDLWTRSEVTVKNVTFANGITVHADSKKPTLQFENCIFAGTVQANVKADGNKIGPNNIGDGMCFDFESEEVGGNVTLTGCESIGRNNPTVSRYSTNYVNGGYKARGYGFATNAAAGDGKAGATIVALNNFHVKGVNGNAVQLSGKEVHTTVKDSFIESWGINSRVGDKEANDDKVSAAFRGARANTTDWTLALENVEFGMDENVDKETPRPTPLVRYVEITGTGTYGGNTDGTLKKGTYSMVNDQAVVKK